MKRRQAIRSILSLPAITTLPALAQQPTDKTKAPAQENMPPEMKPPPVEETPRLAMTAADAATPGTARFFNSRQLETLRRLADVLVPPVNGKPGASDASVPEFLDFLVSESPHDRQALYKAGLDHLDSEARRRFAKPFTGITAQQANDLLAPLQENWTFQGPPDPLGRFLQAAKEDVFRATVNSREWAAAGSQRRGSGGVGSYWYSME
jgi:Gluconate 2-dehydrogenase subunit 3